MEPKTPRQFIARNVTLAIGVSLLFHGVVVAGGWMWASNQPEPTADRLIEIALETDSKQIVVSERLAAAQRQFPVQRVQPKLQLPAPERERKLPHHKARSAHSSRLSLSPTIRQQKAFTGPVAPPAQQGQNTLTSLPRPRYTSQKPQSFSSPHNNQKSMAAPTGPDTPRSPDALRKPPPRLALNSGNEPDLLRPTGSKMQPLMPGSMNANTRTRPRNSGTFEWTTGTETAVNESKNSKQRSSRGYRGSSRSDTSAFASEEPFGSSDNPSAASSGKSGADATSPGGSGRRSGTNSARVNRGEGASGSSNAEETDVGFNSGRREGLNIFASNSYSSGSSGTGISRQRDRTEAVTDDRVPIGDGNPAGSNRVLRQQRRRLSRLADNSFKDFGDNTSNEQLKPESPKPEKTPETLPNKPTAKYIASEVIYAPKPEYPPEARRLKQSGRVRLSVALDARGHVIDATITQSSGYSILDKAAVEKVREYRFRPALRGDTPVPTNTKISIEFNLDADW